MKVLLLFTAFIFVLGCSKNGDVGPQGELGIPGKDGSLIFNGTGIPSPSLGKVGDYYLDLTNGNLYGPKADQGWGSFFNLKGEQGDKGEVGSKGEKGASLLNGTFAPTMSLGGVGDFFLNIKNLELFGPKTAAGWGTPISLKPNLGVRLLFIRPDFHNNYKILSDGSYSGTTKFYEIDLKGQNAHAEFYWSNTYKGWPGPIEAERFWNVINDIPHDRLDYTGGMYQYMENVVLSKYITPSPKGFNVQFLMKASEFGANPNSETSISFLVKLIPISSYENVSKIYRDTDKYFSFSVHRAKLDN